MTSIDDVLSELSFGPVPKQVEMSLLNEPAQPERVSDLDENDRRIVSRLRGGERLSVDDLTGLLRMAPAEVSARLMGLEIRRVVDKRADGLRAGKSLISSVWPRAL